MVNCRLHNFAAVTVDAPRMLFPMKTLYVRDFHRPYMIQFVL